MSGTADVRLWCYQEIGEEELKASNVGTRYAPTRSLGGVRLSATHLLGDFRYWHKVCPYALARPCP
eukprot:3065325-Rhodomonas_salina.1